MKEFVRTRLDRVQQWVEDRNYQGYDPGDGLTSFLRPLTFNSLFAERVLQQLIWKSPINLRPLVGVKPLDSTKGRGFMAWGYLLRYAESRDQAYAVKAVDCLKWLDRFCEPGHIGHCWGNHFDFTTRSGRMPAHTPTIVWTSLIGHAFLEGFEQLGEHRFLDVAESICRWILSLPREVTATGSCLSYTGRNQNSVHNSNLLGAGMLARTWRHRPNREYLAVARAAVTYSCTRQLPDGAWWYGEEPKYHWVDNFHTGYNLDSLRHYISSTGDEDFRGHLNRGYEYFKANFFEASGRPKYYHDRANPADVQCAAQAIDTFCAFSADDPEALGRAEAVTRWTLDNLQDPEGFFYYRQYPLMTARTPYFHWGQSTMFKALSHLSLCWTRRDTPSRQPALATVAS